MAILLCDEEINAMQGNCHFINNLYIFGIRRYMDYQTGIVGIKRHISYQSLCEELYVEPRQGISKAGSPHKSAVRRAIEQLIKIGLLERIPNKKYIIFRLPLAKQDYSARNKPDTNPTHHPDTKPDTLLTGKNPDSVAFLEYPNQKPDTKPDIPFLAKPDTPPLSGKAKEKELLRSSKKKVQLPHDFGVTHNHITLAAQNNWPHPNNEIDAFRDYHMARGTTMVDWDRAFYTWLRNAKKFQGGKQVGNHQPAGKSTSFNRAVENILNSAKRSG